MKILTRKRQQDIYKRIIDVIKVLGAIDTNSDCNYALGDMWQIARYVGGREMVEALEGKNYNSKPIAERTLISLSDSIDMLDELLEG